MRINGGGSSSPTIIRYETTEGATEIFLQGGIEYTIRDSSYVLSVMKLTFLMLIPKN